MRKSRMLASSLALTLSLLCCVSAGAMEVPIDSTVQNLNGVQQYIKTYTVSPELDPASLIEESFRYEGYTYSYSSMTKQENSFADKKEHTEVVTVETGKKDLDAVLDALAPSIEYDDGQYSGVLNLDHTTIRTEAAGYYEGTVRKRKWIPTGLPVKGNKRKAEKLLRDTLTEQENQPKIIKSDYSFSDYIRHWLTVSERRVDAVTFQGYKLLADTHVLPYFDENKVKLQDVTRDILQVYFDEKAKHGRIDGKGGLSPRSLRMHKNIIHQTLNEAVKNGLLTSNPCDFIDLPQQVRFQSKFYSAAQMQALFDAIKNEPLYPLVRIDALYGLRRSEVLGLKWDSVDFENNRLMIRHTVAKVMTTVEKDKTKNASSCRSFPLVPEAKEIFLAAKAEEEENRRLFGKEYHENDYVFKWPDGHPYAPDYISRNFSQLLKRHKLPHIRFHELRHSCASLLLNSGFTLKDVQEWMGHADIKMTADIYGHLDAARKQSMASKLSGTLFT